MCDTPHELELVLLLLLADAIPLYGRRETALGAQRQPLERNVAGSLLDSRLQAGLGLELRFLGRHETKDRGAVFG